jgi:hypothetical protein
MEVKIAITAIISLIIGAVVGGFLAMGIGAGMGAGAGIIVGSQAGACLAVETAKDKGLLSADESDQVIAGTVGKIKGKAQPPEDVSFQWVGSEADCARMIAEMEQQAAQTKPGH